MNLRDALPDPAPPRQSAGGWLLSRHREVASALRDPRFSAESPRRAARIRHAATPDPLDELRGAMFLFRDPPAQRRLRALVSSAFTRRALAPLEERIRAAVRAFPAEREGGCIDLVTALAEPLPVAVITGLLGLPAADRGRLKGWSDDLAVLLLEPGSGSDPHGRARESLLALRDYLARRFEARAARPRDDLLTRLVGLAEPERTATAVLLLVAGHETTTSLIGGAVALLCEFPAEGRRLAQHPGLLRSAVEECLRFASPIRATRRYATEALHLGEVRLRPGERVFCLLGAANRDPAVFEAPGRLDLGRRENPHLAFGSGVHACLGAGLARLETRVVLGELLHRFPRFELAAPRVEWAVQGLRCQPASLPLALGAPA